jgi:hypothetical protein
VSADERSSGREVSPRGVGLSISLPGLQPVSARTATMTAMRNARNVRWLSNASSYAASELNKSERSEHTIDRLAASASVTQR